MTAESQARMAKATRMARALLDQAPASYWLAKEAEHPAPPDFWLTVAQAAGVRSALAGRTPSKETWAQVLDLLRLAEAVAA